MEMKNKIEEDKITFNLLRIDKLSHGNIPPITSIQINDVNLRIFSYKYTDFDTETTRYAPDDVKGFILLNGSEKIAVFEERISHKGKDKSLKSIAIKNTLEENLQDSLLKISLIIEMHQRLNNSYRNYYEIN